MDTESSSLTVLFDEDREVVYEVGDLESLEPAYCLSVHKSQGSEFPVVIMPVLYQLGWNDCIDALEEMRAYLG